MAVRNDFFGKDVTVVGLLTGRDIVAQLKGRDLGDALLVPTSCLRHGEDVFLDDMRLCDVAEKLGVKAIAVSPYADDFLQALRQTP